jgi:hypothetical protein
MRLARFHKLDDTLHRKPLIRAANRLLHAGNDKASVVAVVSAGHHIPSPSN